MLSRNPGQTIRVCSQGRNADFIGFYRMIERKEDSAVTVDNLLSTHCQRSVRRLTGCETVLILQAGTDFRFIPRFVRPGSKAVGRYINSSKAPDLQLHASLAVTEQGLPLGVLGLNYDASPQQSAGKANWRSQRWIQGFQEAVEAADQLTRQTRVISVSDPVIDLCELFASQRRHPKAEVLVRVKSESDSAAVESKLYATIRNSELRGYVSFEVDSQPSSPARLSRAAQGELRFQPLTLIPHHHGEGVETFSVTGIHIRETEPFKGDNPIEWFLLTSMPVQNAEQAARIGHYYWQSRRIEDFFRVLKSECRSENIQFRTALRQKRAITINALIAWRIMVLTLLGQPVPNGDTPVSYSNRQLTFSRTRLVD